MVGELCGGGAGERRGDAGVRRNLHLRRQEIGLGFRVYLYKLSRLGCYSRWRPGTLVWRPCHVSLSDGTEGHRSEDLTTQQRRSQAGSGVLGFRV